MHGNYLVASLTAAGIDPANIPESDPSKMNFSDGPDAKASGGAKAWSTIWGAGQGIGCVSAVRPAGDFIAGLVAEYAEAKDRLAA